MWGNPWIVVYRIPKEDQEKAQAWVDQHYSDDLDQPGMSHWLNMAERLFGVPMLYNKQTGDSKTV